MRSRRLAELLMGAAALWLVCSALAPRVVQGRSSAKLSLAAARESADDLEISGRVVGLPVGRVGYVSREELLGLPQVAAVVSGDPDLGGGTVHVSGVRLSILERAVGAEDGVDVIDLPCSDGYRSYYPAEMVRAHEPILVLTIEGMAPGTWAAKTKQYDPAPYLVVYDAFRPAWRVLAHEDQPQLPTNVVRVDFAMQAETFAQIKPVAESVAAKQGFQIARQNCIRCHAAGATGGSKSDKTWRELALDARERPRWFGRVVKNPKAVNAKATMAANPGYDAATLQALTEYFQSEAAEETR